MSDKCPNCHATDPTFTRERGCTRCGCGLRPPLQRPAWGTDAYIAEREEDLEALLREWNERYGSRTENEFMRGCGCLNCRTSEVLANLTDRRKRLNAEMCGKDPEPVKSEGMRRLREFLASCAESPEPPVAVAVARADAEDIVAAYDRAHKRSRR